MQLCIDGHVIAARPEMSLLALIRCLDLDCVSFSERPIAAWNTVS